MTLTLGHMEAFKALGQTHLQYNSDSTVDIVFPYVFSNGLAWSPITNISTAATGKTTSNIYWLGIYYDGTKEYTPSIPPQVDDITVAWSSANTSEPGRPANGVKIGTYIRGVGDAGGDCDITSFWQKSNKCMYQTFINVTINTDGMATDYSLADVVSPTAIRVMGSDKMTGQTNTTSISSVYQTTGSNTLLETHATWDAGVSVAKVLSTSVDFFLWTPQIARNDGNIVGGSFASHLLSVYAFEE